MSEKNTAEKNKVENVVEKIDLKALDGSSASIYGNAGFNPSSASKMSQQAPSGDVCISIDTAQLTFEKAVQELKQIIQNLENGSLPLDQTVESYQRGSALAAYCQNKLAQAQQTVENITKNSTSDSAGEEILAIS